MMAYIANSSYVLQERKGLLSRPVRAGPPPDDPEVTSAVIGSRSSLRRPIN